MESATILMLLSTGLSGIELSVRTQYSGKVNTILVNGEKFYQLHEAQ